MTIRVIDERKSLRVINQTTRVISRPGPAGPTGADGLDAPLLSGTIDMTEFSYDGDTYALDSQAMVSATDQTAVFVAAFEKAAAEGYTRIFTPPGTYGVNWQGAASIVRSVPANVEWYGAGVGQTIIHAIPASLSGAVAVGTSGTMFVANADRATIHDMTFDGRGDELDALSLNNRTTTLINSSGDYVETYNLEITGQFSKDKEADIDVSIVANPAQITLDAGHGYAAVDGAYPNIMIIAHTGATFRRVADGYEWNGRGEYVVTDLTGDTLTLALEDGGEVEVTVAGSGGYIDTSPTRAFEGSGLALAGLYPIARNIEAHHCRGTGVSFNGGLSKDMNDLTQGFSGVAEDLKVHHNGWQGISIFNHKRFAGTRIRAWANERVGINAEFSQHATWTDCRSWDNGRFGFRALGPSKTVTYSACHGWNNGARDFVYTYYPVTGANDPDQGGTLVQGSNWCVSWASWDTYQGTPEGYKGTPERVILNQCTSEAAPGRYDVYGLARTSATAEWGTGLTDLVIDSPGEWKFASAEAHDSHVRMGARVSMPQAKPTGSIPIPPLTSWTATAGTTMADAAGAYTTGLTSTAGDPLTTINWTSHGFSNGDEVWLENFVGSGRNYLNRQKLEVTVTDANSFTVPIATNSNATGGRGIAYETELAGAVSATPKTITFPATAASGMRYTLPVDHLRGRWKKVRWKVIPIAGQDFLPTFDIGFRSSTGRFYPSIGAPGGPSEWWQWRESEVPADRFLQNAGTYQLAIQLREPGDATYTDYAGFKLTIDYVGDVEVYDRMLLPGVLTTTATTPTTLVPSALTVRAAPNPWQNVGWVGDANSVARAWGGPFGGDRTSDFVFTDDFMGGLGTTGNIGNMGWALNNLQGTGSVSGALGDTDHPGCIDITTGAVANDNILIRPQGQASAIDPARLFQLLTILQLRSPVTNLLVRVGLSAAATTTSGTPDWKPVDGIYYETLPGETVWSVVTRKASAETRTATALATTAAVWRKLRIYRLVTAATTLRYEYASSTTDISVTTNQPVNAVMPFIQIGTSDAVAKTVRVDLSQLWGGELSR